jgi:acetyl esterase
MSLTAPFPVDVEELRRTLIEQGLPPVSELTAEQAQQMYRDRARGVRERWTVPAAMTVRELPGAREYLPLDPTDVTLIWVHGGGWVLGDADTADPVARTIVANTGWRVISVDYRVAPQHPFPAGLDDVHAIAQSTSGGTVLIGGDSAGGNLAAAAAAEHRFDGHVLIYPCVDPSLGTPSAHEFTQGPFLTRSDMEWFYRQYADDPIGNPRIDLREIAVHGWAPTLVFTVGHDPLRDEGLMLVERLRVLGVPLEHIHAPELYHGSFALSGILPSAQARVDEVWTAARRMWT